jgi:hypothetical protein
MGWVYVLRNGTEDLFRIGKTTGPLDRAIEKLSHENSFPFTEFARIETEDQIACEAFLQRLRSKRVVKDAETEFFEVGPSELRQALSEAEEFVAEFVKAKKEAEELSAIEEDSSRQAVKPSSCDLAFYHKLLRVREAQDRLKIRRQFYESKLKISIGHASSLQGLATWNGHWYQHLDLQSFRDADKGLYARLFQMFGSETYKRTFCIQRLEK